MTRFAVIDIAPRPTTFDGPESPWSAMRVLSITNREDLAQEDLKNWQEPDGGQQLRIVRWEED